MFANENYKWMKNWSAPEHTILPECIYWSNLYDKIFREGTAADRVRLQELYDTYNKEDDIIFKILGFFIDRGKANRCAAVTFIYEKVRESSDDDELRKLNLQMEICNLKAEKLFEKIHGFNLSEFDKENMLMEQELQLLHTDEQKRLKYEKNNPFCYQTPGYERIIEQKLLRSGVVKRHYLDTGLCKVNYNIFWEVYDMCDGLYTLLAYTDSPLEPKTSHLELRIPFMSFYTELAGDRGALNWLNISKICNRKADQIFELATYGSPRNSIGTSKA